MNQPKTPGAMVMVPAIATLEMMNAGWQEADRQGIDPESIEMQTIWFAMSSAAPAEQTPAVGWEPVEIGIGPDEVIEELKMMADMADNNEDPDDQLMYMRWLAAIRSANAKVAPLMSEIERLKKACADNFAATQAVEQSRAQVSTHRAKVIAELDTANARIAELEAQQGEPVAWQFQDPDGNWCGFMNERHYQATVSDGTWPIRALYAQAQPATEKVVLPGRKDASN